MKTTVDKWTSATANLIDRRKQWGHSDDNRKIDNVIRDYKTHLSKVFVGNTLLDVGCGSRFLEQCIPDYVTYYGMDAFPFNVSVDFPIAIEDIADDFPRFNTVCAFAVMDNCLDFDLAIKNMKRIAIDNVVILTGIDIEVDKYHTFKLSLNDFDKRYSDWKHGYRELIAPQVYLLEYLKN